MPLSGDGNFGCVQSATWCATTVTVKSFSMSVREKKMRAAFEQEATILSSRSNFVVRMHGNANLAALQDILRTGLIDAKSVHQFCLLPIIQVCFFTESGMELYAMLHQLPLARVMLVAAHA
jgi:hypothetical protein